MRSKKHLQVLSRSRGGANHQGERGGRGGPPWGCKRSKRKAKEEAIQKVSKKSKIRKFKNSKNNQTNRRLNLLSISFVQTPSLPFDEASLSSAGRWGFTTRFMYDATVTRCQEGRWFCGVFWRLFLFLLLLLFF